MSKTPVALTSAGICHAQRTREGARGVCDARALSGLAPLPAIRFPELNTGGAKQRRGHREATGGVDRLLGGVNDFFSFTRCGGTSIFVRNKRVVHKLRRPSNLY